MRFNPKAAHLSMIDDYRAKGLRKKLVRTLQEKGIKDEAVLKAILDIPRHFFFDDIFLDHAYEDKAFPIGNEQTISQPYTVAVQSSLLSIKPGDKVLEIGTGSGYQAAILSKLGAEVYSVEVIKPLFMKARMLLTDMRLHAKMFLGDGSKGLPNLAPFDKIIVTAGGPKVPELLIDQLKTGGILVIPVGDKQVQRMLRIIKKSDKELITEDHGTFRFVPLTGGDGWR